MKNLLITLISIVVVFAAMYLYLNRDSGGVQEITTTKTVADENLPVSLEIKKEETLPEVKKNPQEEKAAPIEIEVVQKEINTVIREPLQHQQITKDIEEKYKKHFLKMDDTGVVFDYLSTIVTFGKKLKTVDTILCFKENEIGFNSKNISDYNDLFESLDSWLAYYVSQKSEVFSSVSSQVIFTENSTCIK